jgi:hypothetical protein
VLREYAARQMQKLQVIRSFKNSVKATKTDVIRNFVNYCLNFALVTRSPPANNSSLANKIRAAAMLVPKSNKRPPNRKEIIFNFTKFAIATAFTPKELRPSMRRDIVWYLVNFSLQMYKSKEFRQRINKERQERRKKIFGS